MAQAPEPRRGGRRERGGAIAEAPRQPCDTAFTTRGRGSGNTKQQALDKAYEDARQTAGLLCREPCAKATFDAYELVEVTGEAAPYTATVEVSWECRE